MGESRDTPTELKAPAGPDRKPGQLIAGKYELVELVARGGMGAVWKALDTQLERPVAIKFMSPVIAHDASARQRFAREAKAAARLKTPHVVQIFEHGIDGDSPFIVMELLKGRDLHRRLKREKRIPIEEAARIVAQIAKGLRAAHEAGIIHRDLKPHNVYLAVEDRDMVVKILDFGVAKMDDSASESTKTGVLLGSPHYMSPEQARGKSDIDHRSDVWSLAVIAFRMITGKMAFSGEGQGDVIIAIATADIPVPSQVNPNLGPPIDQFFVRALQRDRTQRFATAIDLASAFAAAVRECTEASLLTPAHGHPLRPPVDDEEPMERTQRLADIPANQRPPLVSYPSNPGLHHEQPPPSGTPMPFSGAPMSQPTPHPVSQQTPYGHQPPHSQNLATPHSGSLLTPATGPSIGLGPAIFSAPPEPQPQRKLVGLVVVVGVAMACLAIIFAALGTGEDKSSADAETTSEASPAPDPKPAAEPTPPAAPDPEPEVKPEPSASATASATVSAAPEPPPKPTSTPKWKPPPKKDDWDNPGY